MRAAAVPSLLLLLFLFLLIPAPGCQSPPVPAEIPAIVANPAAFDGERVSVTGPVAESTIASNGHAAWRLVLGRPPDSIVAVEEGSNGAVIQSAAALADEAGRRGENVTVTGVVRTGRSGSRLSGLRIELETFRFRDEEIDTDYRDYGPHWYWCGFGPYFDARFSFAAWP